VNNFIEALKTPLLNLKTLILDDNNLTDHKFERILEILYKKDYKLIELSANENNISLYYIRTNYLE
jgi:hypothetical protein